MIYVNINYTMYRTYYSNYGVAVTGKAFINEMLLEGQRFLNYIASLQPDKQIICETAKELNGFFAFIRWDEQRLYAVADRVRSIPLYYGVRGNDFFISDNATWVRDKVASLQIDEKSRQEFKLTGYVTGSRTLYPEVKQIQAGEIVCVNVEDGVLCVEVLYYFEFFHKYQDDITEEELTREHNQVLGWVFQRLIKVANGLPIIIPLSGGYDSRLVALMLKKLGYENIIAFSYGRPGNKESETSKVVAQKLGISWHFVPYSNEKWHAWYNSPEMQEYKNFASGLASLPHIQDWPAVWELKEKKLIPPESIFVPGHSADLLAGSRSMAELYTDSTGVKTNKDVNILLKYVLKYHYSLWDWEGENSSLYNYFRDNILITLGNLENYPDKSSAFEAWDIKERQAKFIINSLRVYEFWGYSWWIPLWDIDYMKFWMSVPLKYRYRKWFYDKYVQNQGERFGIINNAVTMGEHIKEKFKSIIKNIPILYNTAIFLYKKRRKQTEYNGHPLAWYGCIGKEAFSRRYTGRESINSFLVSDYLHGF